MKVSMLALLALGLLASCASAPKGRPAANAFRPDPAKVRAALTIAGGSRLDAPELVSAAGAIWDLCRGVHPVQSQLDLLFDADKDGRIDEGELRSARSFFFGASYLNLNAVDPRLASELAAPPRSSLVAEDLRIWNRYLFGEPEKLLVPHRISNPFERKLAGGHPFQLTQKAIREAVEKASLGAAEWFLFMPQATPNPPPAILIAVPMGPVTTELQDLANTSLSGTVSYDESRIAEKDLNGPPHPAKSAFDRAIDFGGTGYLDMVDLNEARRAAYLPSARFSQRPPASYPVMTQADSLLSMSAEGVVTEDDLNAVAKALAGEAAPPPKIVAAFDVRGSGKLDAGELRRALDAFRPHPVDRASALDLALDARHTGFITADEIGIGAGSTARGQTLSLDMRVKAIRELSRKAGGGGTAVQAAVAPGQSASATARKFNLAGKRLAVVGLANATKDIDQNGLNGTLTFLENAFVNIGSVTIVDRSDINKVMDEMEIQSNSTISDEATAVKVGKLSGAEVIVLGTLSSVGGKYYIEVKLVSVETGEILGSSVAQADSADGFLAMCQQAVGKLF